MASRAHQEPPFMEQELPVKKKKLVKRMVVAMVVAMVVVLPASCAVYFTLRPRDAIDLPHSVGFRTGVRVGGGAEVGADAPQKWYASPEQARKEAGYLGSCEFVSEPLAIEETGRSAAVLYFADKDTSTHDIMEFNVMRLEKKGGLYSAPQKSAAYAFTDTDMDSNGKYLYETVEAKTAFYLYQRFADNFPEPAEGFQYYGVSTDPGIAGLSVLGKHPTGVIDYAYEGTTYYFWYYEGLDVVGYLLSRDDFSLGGFTPRELIAVLGIEVPG